MGMAGLLRRVVPLLLVGGSAWGQAALFAEARLKPEVRRSNHSFYTNAAHWLTAGGYGDLWARHQGHLPTGRGVVVCQVENGTVVPTLAPDVQFTYAPGWQPDGKDSHCQTVARFLYLSFPYKDGGADFEYTYSPGIRTVYAYTSNQFREQVLRLGKAEPPAFPGTKADVVNISNTFGNGGQTEMMRRLDHLIDEGNLLCCSSQPGSLASNASAAGNLWNALVVGKAAPDFGYAEGTEYENLDQRHRRKPDLVAATYMGPSGGASSWTTPMVSSAAAFLLERARTGGDCTRAQRNVVLKAILLAGAAKTGMISPKYDDKGALVAEDPATPYVWSQTPTVPLDKLFGAGCLNIDHSYAILEGGDQQAGRATGWLLGEGVSSARPLTVELSLDKPAATLSVALCWNRHCTLAPPDWPWTVANLRLELVGSNGQVVAWSDDPVNNVEHLWRTSLPAGRYKLVVRSATAEGEVCGLAWRTGG